MTPTQQDRAWACAAMFEITKDEPEISQRGGPDVRKFESGPLTVSSCKMGPYVILDAWVAGLGKVASFRARPGQEQFETVAFKRKEFPRWSEIINFELHAKHGKPFRHA